MSRTTSDPAPDILLAIDTAAPRLQLALVVADRGPIEVDSLVEDMPKGHAERLFPAIEELLARNAVTLADLTRVAVTTGPGSFTGLRIGISAARGLGLARNIPVIGVPTLLALSLSVPGPAAALVDARRGEAYTQHFAGPGQPTSRAALLPLAEAEAAIPAGTAIFAGPFVDIAALARFAATADPAAFPPEPDYIREADAKPQEKFRVARATDASETRP